MITAHDIVKSTNIVDLHNPKVEAGARKEYTFILDVKKGVLPAAPCMHPTKVFHKSTDREKEYTAMRVIELVAPDIAIPMTTDGEYGVYMRFVRGMTVQYRRTYHAQHKYDFGCIAVIDALIGNTDRHSGNAIVSKEHVYPIDHGCCFTYGVLSPTLSFMDDWTRTSIRNEAVYRGVCDTLDRAVRYSSDIEQVIGYTATDIRRWAAKLRKYATGAYLGRRHRRW